MGTTITGGLIGASAGRPPIGESPPALALTTPGSVGVGSIP
ncbi:MAG: hypothetical protein K0R68_3958, partial [Mycobacterium sp.]|nr:hypothetical protein [Mycobacterium sp.]